MAQTEVAKSTIYIDDKQARESLKQLKDSVSKYTAEMDKARKANDHSGFEKAKKAFDEANKELKQYTRTVVDVEKVLNNLNGSSYSQLMRAQRSLTMSTRNMTKNTKEEIAAYNQKLAQLKKIRQATTDVRLEMNKATRSSTGMLSSLSSSFNKFGFLSLGAGASIYGIKSKLDEAVVAANKFEDSLANLSALTGLVGPELAYLSERAKDFSGSTLDSGIRITQTAQEMLDAYTIMGSKRPELLKDKDALASVTEQAIILASASKMELVPSTEALAVAMNQFNASATDAPRYINSIAAGSKVGAGNVQYLADALEKSGTSADMAGLSLEQTIAVIETIAPKFGEANMAGTQLKNVFIKLQTGADEFNPSIVGMNQALENLSNANLGATELTKIFGVENINAAKALIAGKDQYYEFAAAVTDTNVATEQAIKNTNTNSKKTEQARAEMNKYAVELGEKLAPAYVTAANTGTLLMKGLMAGIDVFNEHKLAIISVSVALAAYTAATKLQSNWDKISGAYTLAKTTMTKAYGVTTSLITGKITLATAAQKAWNLAMKANPIGIVISLVAAAATAFALYNNKVNEVSRATKDLNDVTLDAKKSIASEKTQLDILLATAKDETISKEHRLKAIEDLRKIAPDYLKDLTLEKIGTQETKKAIDDYLLALEKKAKAQAAQNKYDQIEAELQELKLNKNKAELSWWEQFKAMLQGQFDVVQSGYYASKIALDNYKDAEGELIDSKEQLLQLILDINNEAAKMPEGPAAIQYPTTFADYIAPRAQINPSDYPTPLTGTGSTTTDPGGTKDEPMTLDQYIAKNKESFDAYKKATSQFIDDQQEWELNQRYHNEYLDTKEVKAIDDAEKKKAEAKKEAQLKYEAILNQEFNLDEEVPIEEDPNVLHQMLINQMELDMWAQTQEGKLAIAEQTMSKEEMMQKAHQYSMQRMDQETNRAKLESAMQYVQMASQIANGLSMLYQAQMNKELAAVGDNEEAKELIRAKYNKRQQNVAVMQALMNGALSVMSMWANAPNPIIGAIYTAIVAGVTAAEIAVIKSQQFAEGNRAQVMGNQDGRVYNAKVVDSKHKSGIYSEPTFVPGFGLFGETKDPELVFNPADTQKIIDSPALVDAINMTLGNSPQYASGNSTEIIRETNTVTTTTMDDETRALLISLQKRLEQPVQLVTNEEYLRTHRKEMDKYTSFKDKVG